jgi:hypothetical protein
LKLTDLRKLAIRSQFRIHFRMRNGQECLMDEHGIARVPDFQGIPDFNLEEELGFAQEFLLESSAPAEKGKAAPPRPRQIVRLELEAMVSAAPGAAAAAHEEE